MNPSNIKATARKWIRRLGLGFHPDTPGNQYVEGGTNKRSLTGKECRDYDAEIAQAFAACKQLNWDFYNICIEVCKEEGLYNEDFPEAVVRRVRQESLLDVARVLLSRNLDGDREIKQRLHDAVMTELERLRSR